MFNNALSRQQWGLLEKIGRNYPTMTEAAKSRLLGFVEGIEAQTSREYLQMEMQKQKEATA